MTDCSVPPRLKNLSFGQQLGVATVETRMQNQDGPKKKTDSCEVLLSSIGLAKDTRARKKPIEAVISATNIKGGLFPRPFSACVCVSGVDPTKPSLCLVVFAKQKGLAFVFKRIPLFSLL